MAIAHEELLVGEAVADPVELLERHVDLGEHLVEGVAEIAGGELAVVRAHQVDRIGAREPASPHVHARVIGRPPEAVLEELEVVVDAGVHVVEVLVVDERSLDRSGIGLETVCL